MLYNTKRQVKMHYNMCITAVCLLFLIKLKWPKNKSIYAIRDQKPYLFQLRACKQETQSVSNHIQLNKFLTAQDKILF